MTELPKTFHDAVIVSRVLQVRYLWIDSLCIRQDKDDLSDWNHEASLMDKVYSHSHLNISASHGGSSSEGLFRTRDPRIYDRVEVDLCIKDRSGQRAVHRPYVVTDFYLFNDNVARSALNQRGWVLQERILAPRVLHFCREQLFWECRNHVACEQYALGLPSAHFAETPHLFIKSKDAYQQDDEAPWYTLWNDLVFNYSRMSLTYPEDKMVALSGVAKMVRSRVNDQYVAGIWRKNLVNQIVWETYFHGQGRFYPTPGQPHYRAPSWSWASIDHPIFYFGKWSLGESDQPLIEVEDVQVEYASGDDTGRIQNAWLDLKGNLKPLYLTRTQGTDREQDEPWDAVFLPEYGAPRPPFDDFIFCGAAQLDNPLVEERIIQHDSENGLLFYMPIARFQGDYENDYKRDDAANKFLFFRLVNTEGKLFQRLGLGRINSSKGLKLLQGELTEDVKRALPCLRYEDGKHTIRII